MANTPVIFEPSGGATLKGASRAAVEIAQDLKRDTGGQQDSITFIFSTVAIPVKSDDDPADVMAAYEKASAAQRAEQAVKAAPKQAGDQAKVNVLLDMLDDVIPLGDNAVIKWIGRLNPVSGIIGVNVPRDEISGKLKTAGYISDEYKDGDPQRIETNKTIMGRYIIGQVISHLDERKPMDRYIDVLLGMYDKMSDAPAAAAPDPSADTPPSSGGTISVMRKLSLKPKS